VWAIKWFAEQDEVIKEAILGANPADSTDQIFKWQGMRTLIESFFQLIQEVRDGNQGIQ